jgi:hypothetical protein
MGQTLLSSASIEAIEEIPCLCAWGAQSLVAILSTKTKHLAKDVQHVLCI